jgi:hypothetical protein
VIYGMFIFFLIFIWYLKRERESQSLEEVLDKCWKKHNNKTWKVLNMLFILTFFSFLSIFFHVLFASTLDIIIRKCRFWCVCMSYLVSCTHFQIDIEEMFISIFFDVIEILKRWRCDVDMKEKWERKVKTNRTSHFISTS